MQRQGMLKAMICLGVLLFARLMPHLPNFSPYTSLVLLLGCQLTRREALFLTFGSLVLSDLALALLFGYSVFGLWSLFTYTGFLAVALGSAFFLNQQFRFLRVIFYALSSVFGYWLWTNFGTWITTDLYAHSISGFGMCLIAGLPFLQSSMMAALVYVPICFGLIRFLEDRNMFAI